MRWKIHLPDGRVQTGEDAPPDVGSVVYFISAVPDECMMFDRAKGLLYKNGRKAEPGTYRVPFASGTLPIVVTTTGRASRRPIEPPAPPVTPPTPPAGGGTSAQGR